MLRYLTMRLFGLFVHTLLILWSFHFFPTLITCQKLFLSSQSMLEWNLMTSSRTSSCPALAVRPHQSSTPPVKSRLIFFISALFLIRIQKPSVVKNYIWGVKEVSRAVT